MDEARQQVDRLIKMDMMINGTTELEASKRILDRLTKNVVETPEGVKIKNKKKGYNKPSKETLEWIKRNMKN